MRYNRDGLINLARAVVLQAARDYAQGIIQPRFRAWHDRDTCRGWLERNAEGMGDVDPPTLIRRVEEGAAEFLEIAERRRRSGIYARCPLCGGTVSIRGTRFGTRFVRCGTCAVSYRFGRENR